MWVPKGVIDWFHISKESVDSLRTELAAVRAERDSLKTQLAVTQTNFDWLRMKINQLEFERTGLIERAYDIKLPAPEIVRQPAVDPTFDPRMFTGFDDVGESVAKKLGLPIYEN